LATNSSAEQSEVRGHKRISRGGSIETAGFQKISSAKFCSIPIAHREKIALIGDFNFNL